MTRDDQFDAIVVGLGAMGSAALYHLASRGVKVLGVDQARDAAHPRIDARAHAHHSRGVLRASVLRADRAARVRAVGGARARGRRAAVRADGRPDDRSARRRALRWRAAKCDGARARARDAGAGGGACAIPWFSRARGLTRAARAARGAVAAGENRGDASRARETRGRDDSHGRDRDRLGRGRRRARAHGCRRAAREVH